MTDHPRLTRYTPYVNGAAFMGMLRQNAMHPETFGPDFDWTHGPYVLASEADAEIERLRAEVERLRSDQPQDQSQDQSICGDDGPITPEECARWLEAQYARHGELEDRAAAQWLRRLCAEVERLAQERGEWARKWHRIRGELAEIKWPGMKGVIRPKRAYYETHEPPHCPTCGCAS